MYVSSLVSARACKGLQGLQDPALDGQPWGCLPSIHPLDSLERWLAVREDGEHAGVLLSLGGQRNVS